MLHSVSQYCVILAITTIKHVYYCIIACTAQALVGRAIYILINILSLIINSVML